MKTRIIRATRAIHIARLLPVLLLAALSALTPFASAQTNNQIVKVKGQGSAPYSGSIKETVVRAAIVEAKRDALQRYVAQFTTSRRANYMKVEEEVLKRLEQVVPNAVILSEDRKSTSKLYSVVIEAGIDDNLIEQIIQADSKKERAAVAKGTKQENYITFVFVARELASSTSFRAKETSVVNRDSERRGANSTGGDASTTTASETSGITDIAQAGGTDVSQSNDRKYRVFTVNEVDAAVNNVLTVAGYEVVGAIDASLNVAAFKSDYESGDIQPTTRQVAVQTCRGNQINYLGTASMDVGIPERDTATGMWRVYVTVNSQVSDLRGRFPKTAASIAGKAYAGLGSNTEVARTNALNTAAAEMASELVDQLRLKAVQ